MSPNASARRCAGVRVSFGSFLAGSCDSSAFRSVSPVSGSSRPSTRTMPSNVGDAWKWRLRELIAVLVHSPVAVDRAARVLDDPAELARVHRFGGVDELGFEGLERLEPLGSGGGGEDGRVLAGDVADRKGLGEGREVVELPRYLDRGAGFARGEADVGAQPHGGTRRILGRPFHRPVVLSDPSKPLELDSIGQPPELAQVDWLLSRGELVERELGGPRMHRTCVRIIMHG